MPVLRRGAVAPQEESPVPGMPFTQLPDHVDVGGALMSETTSAVGAAEDLDHVEPSRPRWRVALLCETVRARILLRRAIERAGGRIVGDVPLASADVAALQQAGPDIVIFESTGRDHGGLELVMRLAAPPRWAWVLLTGEPYPPALKLAREAGVMACLVEPLHLDQVAPTLELAAARFTDLKISSGAQRPA